MRLDRAQPRVKIQGTRRRLSRPRLERLEDRTAPATHVWQGPATGGLWSTAANWTNGAPTTGEAGGTIVQFGVGIDSTDNIAGLVVDELHFTSSSNLVRGAGNVTLGISGLVAANNLVSDAGLNTIDASLKLDLQGTTVDVFLDGGGIIVESRIT